MKWVPKEVAKAIVWTVFMLLCLAWAVGAIVNAPWVSSKWIELTASLILIAVGSLVYSGLEKSK